jgi:hypothetical protein
MSSRNVQFVKYITTNPQFLRNLYKLGVSAREKRESIFHVHLLPKKGYWSSEVERGGIAHVSEKGAVCPPVTEILPASKKMTAAMKYEREELLEQHEELTTVLQVHNHPVIETKRRWGDFFSEADLYGMASGKAIGLASIPPDSPVLGMVMAQSKITSIPALLRGLPEKHRKALQEFNALIPRLLYVWQITVEQLAVEHWMLAATLALSRARLSAAAIGYRFPFDCSEAQFLSINTANKILTKKSCLGRTRGSLSALKVGRQSIEERMKADREGLFEIELEEQEFKRMEYYRVVSGKKIPIGGVEYTITSGEMGFLSLGGILKEKVSLTTEERIELARQMIEKLQIGEYYQYKHDNHLDWKVNKEDAERIVKMSLYGAAELRVLFSMPIEEMHGRIDAGEIKPDFTVQVEGGASYFFLEIPPALARKGK